MNSPTRFPGSAMRYRITLQQPVLTSDGAGGFTRSWVNVVDLWAAILPIIPPSRGAQSSETLADQHLQAHLMYRFSIRYYAGLTADMRIAYESRLFNIRAIVDPDETKTRLQLVAEEGVAP